MRSSVYVTKDEQKKPHVHTFYDHTKWGVDVVDLISSQQTTRFRSPRLPVNAIAFLLDTIQTNSKISLAEYSKPDVMSAFEFAFHLGKQLLLPAILHRFENSNGIQSSNMQKMKIMLCTQNIHRPIGNVNEFCDRCDICVSKIVGIDNYKQKRKKINNKSKNKKPRMSILWMYCSFPLRLCFMRRVISVIHNYSDITVIASVSQLNICITLC